MLKRSLLLLLGLLLPVSASATLINGDFSSSLTGWTASGAAQAFSGHALLADGADQSGSTLFQIVALAAGDYTFSFDYMNNLSSSVPTGFFADSVFATLYFADAPADFDVNSSAATSVLQINHSGAISVAGTLSASGLGAGWTHLSFQFTNAFADVIPYFELIDLNGVGSDSSFLVDNVQFDVAPVVPEPATLWLLSLGLLLGILPFWKRLSPVPVSIRVRD